MDSSERKVSGRIGFCFKCNGPPEGILRYHMSPSVFI